MITVRQMLNNVAPGVSVSGYRGILLRKYEEYRRATQKTLITASYTLPYSNKFEQPCFYVHWKILSENLKKEKVWYDVVIQFNTDNGIKPDTQIRVYCNSHQFVYTYAYCFNKSGDLLFPNMYPKIVLSEPPKIKNPNCQLGMDKHIYVALKESIGLRLTYDKISKLGKTEWTDIPGFEKLNEIVMKIQLQNRRLNKNKSKSIKGKK
jgi:hypothetical protein